MRQFLLRVWMVLALMLSGAGAAHAAAPASLVTADPVNVYTTPGYHTVNGRQWHTVCGAYSSTIDRCRTEIVATQVNIVNGRYVTTTGWVFNNLTYLPAPRTAWKGNPLAIPGQHTIGGRQWLVECDNASTGANACRASILATVIAATKTASGVTYRQVTKWVFNNIILFTGPAAPPVCNGALLPAGFAITNGRPHVTKAPYADVTLYNPTSISNFIRITLNDTRNSLADRTCLATLGGDALLAGALTKPTPSGSSALWYPYMFAFSANPSTSTLQPGWISGLAQGAALGSLSLLYDATGNERWLTAAQSTFESYLVPIEQGGFDSLVQTRNGSARWFQEYPSDPPTTVLNGHLESVISLDLWQRRSHDPRATALFKEAVADLKKVLPDEFVPVNQGTLTSYDQVRGYPSAPLRIATAGGLTVQSVEQVGGAKVSMPVTAPARDNVNLLGNSGFDSWTSGFPTGWTRWLGSASSFSNVSGTLAIKGTGTGWQAASQVIPAAKMVPGAKYRLSWLGRTSYTPGVDAASGRVVAVSRCGSTSTTIADSNITRAKALSQIDMLVTAPAKGCDVQVLLYQSVHTDTNTTVYYDNVTFSLAQSAAGAANLVWPLQVQSAPTSKLSVTSSGVGEVQAYDQGRWWSIGKLNSTAQSTTVVTVPERFTGRNIHYGYHELHVEELISIYRRTADPYFLDVAQAWRPLAPTKEHLFTSLSTFPYEGVQAPTADALASPLDAMDTERLADDVPAPGSDTTLVAPKPVAPTAAPSSVG